eukprot:gene13266-28094_t
MELNTKSIIEHDHHHVAAKQLHNKALYTTTEVCRIMGAKPSRSEVSETTPLTSQPPKLRTYRPPDVRAKDRFEIIDKSNTLQLFDSSIDKYDYLIIFPLSEGPLRHASAAKVADERISWRKITQLWRQCVPGTDEMKTIAVDALAHFWQNRVFSYPEPSDELPLNAFITLARETVIDQLSQKSGLQLKLSSSTGYLYCRVRAPTKLLELQAKKEGYRLQFKGEIDPGSKEFWNRDTMSDTTHEMIALEIEEEKKLYSRDEANVILERLYKADKISPNDLGILKDKETPITWSRRTHALERVADEVPITNRYPAYAPFSSEQNLRYLFQNYPSVRGKTLFTGKDRLYLTKSILENHFDLDVLVSEGVIDSFTALHDANRGETLTIDILKKRWIMFWNAPSNE